MQPHHIDVQLLSEEALRERIDALAAEIGRDFRGRDLAMIGILRGSFIFLADLVRALHRHGVRSVIDFIVLESYGAGTESSGRVRLNKDFRLDVTAEDVLLVDDILDTGRTLSYAAALLRERGAKSVRTCALLDKPARRVVPFQADYVGFTIEDAFVVGYGLDYDHHYRELPYVAKVTFTA